MAKYIPLKGLKAKMKKYGFHAPDMTITEFVDDELSAVEAAPLTVRCKDCLYGRNEKMPGGIWVYCRLMGAEVGWMDANDFCSNGKRRGADT